jgi:dTDP-4-amino-4,6-dideoxygalactose transaminase
MVKYLDLRAQYASISEDLESAVLEVLRSGSYVNGDRVEEFEKAFASFCGTRFAVGVSTGTSALHLALLAAGVGPGDEVVTTPLTFVATVAAIVYTGARPVFVDVDAATWTLDSSKLAHSITGRTKAVIPVHLHGRLAAMEEIREIADHAGIIVIEDAAQAHGAKRGRSAGAFGHMGCFSFYPGKNLGACGEGGAVTCDSPEHSNVLRSLRDWGQTERYVHTRLGFNYRMDNIQGAVLAVKLRHLERWTEARRRIAKLYWRTLSPHIGRPAGPIEEDHACHVFAVRVPNRDEVRKALTLRGIESGIHYPVPVHLQPAYSFLGHGPGDFPVAEAVAGELLSLPIYPELSEAEALSVVGSLNDVMADRHVAIG